MQKKINAIKKVRKILIFPSTSNIALEIISALKNENAFELFLASSLEEISPYYLPYVSSEKFQLELNSLIKNLSIDIIFPAHDLFLDWLSDNWNTIPAKIVSDYPHKLKKYRSKSQTYKFLKDKLRTPEIYADYKEIKLPIFVKPDKGYGSKSISLIKNITEYKTIPKDSDMLFLEYLPGKEYTVDCISDNQGNLIDYIIRERVFVQSGISRITKIIKDRKDIREFTKKIAGLTKIRGGWFLQVKDDNANRPCLLEIGTRISGNMGLIRANGINIALLSILILIDKQNIKTIKNKVFDYLIRNKDYEFSPKIKIKKIYIGFDNIVFIKEKINPFCIALLTQCKNLNINCTLITKSKKDVNTILKKNYLLNYFQEIIQIHELLDEKLNYIDFKHSIFIDNSFSERKNIFQSIGIPVFSCDMIETLITHIESYD